MTIKTTLFLTISSILLIANFIIRTPAHPSDIITDPHQLTNFPNTTMYASGWSDKEYQTLKISSQEERDAQRLESLGGIYFRLGILTSIENRGINIYNKAFQKLPTQVQCFLPAPPEPSPGMPNHFIRIKN